MKSGALLLCVAIGAGLTGCSKPTGHSGENPNYAVAIQRGENPQRPETIALGIGEATYEVEVAGRGYGLSLGLMHRTKMGADEGMWFEFPDEEIRRFWMKNTKIPLSIAFVTSEGTLTNIEDMVPYVEQNTLSVRPAKYALEMNRGWFKKKGIEAGDTIRIGKVRKK
jgi:hypothetical protein